MTTKLDQATAQTIAARVGVTLNAEAARNAALSMAALLEAADGYGRALAFEAEPGAYLAAQRRGK